jgi:hypothetical protein
MIFGFSVAAGGAVILYTSNVIIEAKNKGAAHIAGELGGLTQTIDESQATDGLIYTLNGNTYTVTGYTGTSSTVKIPSTHEGLDVTAIGTSAFRNNGTIKNVEIGYGVKHIGQTAFYNTYLETINFPESVIEFGDSCLGYCSKLSYFNFPSGVTKIPSGFISLSYTNDNFIRSLTIPETITEIGSSAFSHRTKMAIDRVPRSVTKIGGYAFNSCYAIKTFNIPSSVTYIGAKTFDYSYSIKTINIEAESDTGWDSNWLGNEWWGNAERRAGLTINYGVSM